MSCVTIRTCVKPQEAMVWAFMVLRRLWPDACGCDVDNDPWSGLQRAYTTKPYRVFENVQALSVHLTGQPVQLINVIWDERLVICGDQLLLDKLVELPQWQHLVNSYPQTRLIEVADGQTWQPQLVEVEPDTQSDDLTLEFPMADLRLGDEPVLEQLSGT